MKAVWVAVLSLMFCAAYPGTDVSFTGNYYLKIQELSRFGTDILRIRSMDGKTVTGEVGIDWGIGPQARKPADYEKYYLLPFRAKVLHDGRAFRFSVTVPGIAVYDFTLFCQYDRDYRKQITGSVNIAPARNAGKKETGLLRSRGTYGVIAERVVGEK